MKSLLKLAYNPTARYCFAFCAVFAYWVHFAMHGMRWFDSYVYDDDWTLQDASIVFVVIASILTAAWLWLLVKAINSISD